MSGSNTQGEGMEQDNQRVDNFFSPQNRDWYATLPYKTLKPDERKIRLLRIHLHGGNFTNSTPIECDLLDNVSLADMEGKFTTISYCAGDPKQTETITVNNIHFNASANLGHALRQARKFWNTYRGDQECLLWADQVCIDQSNTNERSHQVGFMGDIYAAAEQVLISLSTESGLHKRVTLEDGLAAQEASNIDFKVFSKYVRVFRGREDLQNPHGILFNTLLCSPYWKRAWVRQEYVRSRQAQFLVSCHCCQEATLERIVVACRRDIGSDKRLTGEVATSFNELDIPGYNSSIHIRWPAETCSGYWSARSTIREFLYIKLVFKSITRSPLLFYYLEHAVGCEASDPRDLIYAFLGLSSHNYGISPAYSADVSIEDLGYTLARKAILHFGNLEGLRFDGWSWSNNVGTDVRFLRWVPPWSRHNWIYTRTNQWNHDIVRGVSEDLTDCSKGRILRVRAIRQLELQSVVHDYFSGHDPLTRQMKWCLIDGRAEVGDEVWWIYGSTRLYTLRKHEKYFQLITFVEEKDDAARYYGHKHNFEDYLSICLDRAKELVENNDLSVQTIGLC